MTNDGGTVRYHRAEFRGDGRRLAWDVEFTPGGPQYVFTAAEGEAMGLTPPEPAPLVVTCNGHDIELSDEEAEQLDTLRNAIGDPDELLAPAQCPTCGSDDPQTFRSYRPAQDPWMLHGCPDPWHVGGSGDTR